MTQSDKFRDARGAGHPLFNAWTTIGSPYVIELMGEAGADVVLIDQQHGIGGDDALVNCLIGARAAGLPALVRVANNDMGLIGRALDAGAQGIVCPLVSTPDDTERLVQAVKYPPRGVRSWGPFRGKYLIDGDYFAQANDWTIACAQIETKGAMEHLDAILGLDGLDMALVGPNDLSVALSGGKLDIRAPEMTDALDEILRRCREHDVIAAIFANDLDYAKPLAEAGWDVITVGTDAGTLTRAMAAARAALIGE